MDCSPSLSFLLLSYLLWPVSWVMIFYLYLFLSYVGHFSPLTLSSYCVLCTITWVIFGVPWTLVIFHFISELHIATNPCGENTLKFRWEFRLFWDLGGLRNCNLVGSLGGTLISRHLHQVRHVNPESPVGPKTFSFPGDIERKRSKAV